MTCTPFRMIMDNQLNDMTLSATPDTPETLPVEHLTDEQRSRVMRSQLMSDQSELFVQQVIGQRDDGRAMIADGFGLSRHNLTGNYDGFRLVLRLEGEIVYDSSVVSLAILIPLGIWRVGINYYGEPYDTAGLDSVRVIWFDPVAYDHMTVQFFKRPNADPYQTYYPWIDVGMVFLGQSISPQHNFSWGNTINWQHGIELTRTEGHSLLSEGGADPHRQMTLNLEHMNDQDRNLLSPACRRAVGQPVLVSAYPESDDLVRATEYTMIAKIVDGADWTHTSYQHHEHKFEFREV